jgi:exodeoxyribonuclease VII large subunit
MHIDTTQGAAGGHGGYDQDSVFSVTDVTRHLKHIIESTIPQVLVEGEIANFTRHRSGHIYFSLKDANATLRCVFFRSHNVMLPFKPKEGDKVVCSGRLSVYERSGAYQLNVVKMFPSGVGELQMRFEALKRKLDALGMFDEAHKKPLPAFPRSIGVVTSATGAAIQDIRTVISRRWPCRILLYPAVVQGPDAPPQIIRGIEYFNHVHPVDLLIVGRGGGSQEDLFCFNDEALAQSIFQSTIPVISAVGHEIDFSISDFVADVRAATPSAAAELAVPDRTEILGRVDALQHRLQAHLGGMVNRKHILLHQRYNALTRLHPRQKLRVRQQQLDEAELRLGHLLERSMEKTQNRLNMLAAELQELSPLAAMRRGYAIARHGKKVLHSVQDVTPEQRLEVVLHDGRVMCDVREIHEEN